MVTALRSHFPEINADGVEVEWDPKPRKINEITTYRLPKLELDRRPSSAMQTLADALVAEAVTGKRRDEAPAELVIAICDVELGNLNREHIILEHLRSALAERLSDYDLKTRERHRETVRNRCSFHLIRPMVEAAFFGDAATLVRAGVSPTVRPSLVSADLEEFESDDLLWLPTCTERNLHKQQNLEWWREEKHAKHYLEHLSERGGGATYDEIKQGVGALSYLDWGLATRGQPSPFLRALFDDIAAFFGVPSPLGPGVSSPLTSLAPDTPQDRWLRNL